MGVNKGKLALYVPH